MKTDQESVIKGIGNSLTTPKDLKSNEEVKYLIYVLSESVGERLRRHNLKGRTVQISVRDNGLGVIERQAPLAGNTYVTAHIAEKAYEVFLNSWSWEKTIRSLGVRTTNLVTADTHIQLSLFEDESRKIKKELLDRSIDKIRERFGHYSVQRALMLKDPDLNANPVEENIIHPVSIFRSGV
jgi:DNA polymerase-4